MCFVSGGGTPQVPWTHAWFIRRQLCLRLEGSHEPTVQVVVTTVQCNKQTHTRKKRMKMEIGRQFAQKKEKRKKKLLYVCAMFGIDHVPPYVREKKILKTDQTHKIRRLSKMPNC